MFILVRLESSQISSECVTNTNDPIKTKIADLVEIAPEDFRKKSKAAIEDNINAKYANKVIQKIGLCICLYDLLWTSEGLIGHGTGLVNVNGTNSGLSEFFFGGSPTNDCDSGIQTHRLQALQGRGYDWKNQEFDAGRHQPENRLL